MGPANPVFSSGVLDQRFPFDRESHSPQMLDEAAIPIEACDKSIDKLILQWAVAGFDEVGEKMKR